MMVLPLLLPFLLGFFPLLFLFYILFELNLRDNVTNFSRIWSNSKHVAVIQLNVDYPLRRYVSLNGIKWKETDTITLYEQFCFTAHLRCDLQKFDISICRLFLEFYDFLFIFLIFNTAYRLCIYFFFCFFCSCPMFGQPF